MQEKRTVVIHHILKGPKENVEGKFYDRQI